MIYAARAARDVIRIEEFLTAEGAEVVSAAYMAVREAIALLARHPLIGRPVEEPFRELVISRGKTGYIALYRFDEDADQVVVLRIRHQRELS